MEAMEPMEQDATPAPPAPPSQSSPTPGRPMSFSASTPKALRANLSVDTMNLGEPSLAVSPIQSPMLNKTNDSDTVQSFASRRSTVRSKELFEHGQKIQEKLEAQRAKTATKDCTFQPQLPSKQKERDGESGSVFNNLFKDNQKRAERLAHMQEEAHKGDSFKPDISLTKNSPFKDSQQNAAEKRYELLYKDASKRSDKVKEIGDRIYGDVTFAPHMERTKLLNQELLQKRPQLALVDRLYNAEHLRAKVEEHQQLKEAQEMAECTFAPTLKAQATEKRKTSLETKTPVHERLYTDAKRSTDKKSTRRQDLDKSEMVECTFQPGTTARARSKSPGKSLSADASAGGSVFDRLFKSSETHRARREDLKIQLEDPECTFRPNVSGGKPGEAGSSGPSSARHDPTRTLKMYQDGKALQEKKNLTPRDPVAALKNRLEEEELTQCTFSPDTSHTIKSPFRLKGREENLFEALYNEKDKFALARQEAASRHTAEETFKPELVSQKTAAGRELNGKRGADVFEALYKDKDSIGKNKADLADRLQSAECTFQPQLVTKATGNMRKSPISTPKGKYFTDKNRGASMDDEALANALPPTPGDAVVPPMPPSEEQPEA